MAKVLEKVGDLYQLFVESPDLEIRAKKDGTTLTLHDYYVEAGIWYQTVHYSDSPARFKIDTLGEVGGIIEMEATDAEWRDDIFKAPIDRVKNLKLGFVIGYLGYGELDKVKTYENCEVNIEGNTLWIIMTESQARNPQ